MDVGCMNVNGRQENVGYTHNNTYTCPIWELNLVYSSVL